MSKERLEEIKKSYNFWAKEDESIGLLPEDIEWLIGRVQELENENRILRTVAESNKYIGEQYLEQNKLYREALEFYADKNNMIGLEMGEKARKVLEESK